MSVTKTTEKHKLPALNQLVEWRRLEAFNKAFEELKQYAIDHKLPKPSKGTFLSDIVGVGLEVVSPEVYYKTPRA